MMFVAPVGITRRSFVCPSSEELSTRHVIIIKEADANLQREAILSTFSKQPSQSQIIQIILSHKNNKMHIIHNIIIIITFKLLLM